MTLPDFLAQLAQTPRDWQIVEGRFLRRVTPKGNECPVSALCGMGARDVIDAAETLGMDEEIRLRVVYAADGTYTHDPALRQQLLDACGIR